MSQLPLLAEGYVNPGDIFLPPAGKESLRDVSTPIASTPGDVDAEGEDIEENDFPFHNDQDAPLLGMSSKHFSSESNLYLYNLSQKGVDAMATAVRPFSSNYPTIPIDPMLLATSAQRPFQKQEYNNIRDIDCPRTLEDQHSQKLLSHPNDRIKKVRYMTRDDVEDNSIEYGRVSSLKKNDVIFGMPKRRGRPPKSQVQKRPNTSDETREQVKRKSLSVKGGWKRRAKACKECSSRHGRCKNGPPCDRCVRKKIDCVFEGSLSPNCHTNPTALITNAPLVTASPSAMPSLPSGQMIGKEVPAKRKRGRPPKNVR
ncbi:hypothetical protein L204_100448 [Cryptococcus depauperatus]|nr:hypothetical protein L204_02070 [Cryptococcus depauperatus CBS 7855]